MSNIENMFAEVKKKLPNMSKTEEDIALQRLSEGYSVSETVDSIMYNLGGYSVEEYIDDEQED